MAQTFFFYDLETSGLDPRTDRIMQFAGWRTDLELQPIGQPVDFLVKLSDDTLPSPEALLVTGLTPQKTLAEGLPEHEFIRRAEEEFFTPGTVAIGYNNIRFDDEFMRHTCWRNFFDPYEWSWLDKRSRWDMLDVVRLTRALRPDGVRWPVVDGKAVNKLELLARENHIKQTHAHDALSDVEALIGVARLIRSKQPKLFDYLFKLREKKAIAELVNLENPAPFVYASGRYGCAEKTTVAFPIAPGRQAGSVLVYDLRVGPAEVESLLAGTLGSRTPASQGAIRRALSPSDHPPDFFYSLPVKELRYNRCPAVAPLSVLDKKSQTRLDLPLDVIHSNLEKLLKSDVKDKLVEVWNARPDYPKSGEVECQLYDSFTPDVDKPRVKAVREADARELADFHPDFADERLSELLFRYKARQFPDSLSEAEQKKWLEYKTEKFQQQLPGLFERIAKLSETTTNQSKLFILEELQLFIESNMPVED